MQQCVFHQYPDTQVKYQFKCRNAGVKLGFLKTEVQNQINSMRNVGLSKDEVLYLMNYDFLTNDYLIYLNAYRFDPSEVKVSEENGELKITIEGSWLTTILWEVPILAIVNELYFLSQSLKNAYVDYKEVGIRNLNEKIEALANYPDLKFVEFGTRRRFSKDWQEYITTTLRKDCPSCCGTSNVKLAQLLGIKATGTMAHEFISAHLSLANRIEDAQKMALYAWLREYDNDLSVVLTDTFTTDAFFKDFKNVLSNAYKGLRQDSGDPIEFGRKALEHYKKMGIDPKTKTIVFSDGLNIPKAIEIYNTFKGQIGILFGIGTDLTNDVGYEALNIVIKLIECNGKPVVKLSDNVTKAMGDAEMIEKVKKAYGVF